MNALSISVMADYAPEERDLAGLRSGLPESELTNMHRAIRERDGLGGVAQFMNTLRAAAGAKALRYTVGPIENPFAALTPLSPDFQLVPPLDAGGPAARQKYQLSRFVCIHCEGGAMKLESPEGVANMTMSTDAAALALRFAQPCSLQDLIALAPEHSTEHLAALVRLLLGCKAIAPEGIEEPDLATWEFHDLLFHTRSRSGRSGGTLGGTYRFLGQREPLPAVSPPGEGEIVDLPRPKLSGPSTCDAPFAAVLEQRRSRRAHGAEPITLAQLAEFLFRCVRVRNISEQVVQKRGREGCITVSSRPYPCGGASHEIDHYLTVARCAGLDPGLYYYDPQEHRLVRRSGLTESAGQLLLDARRSVGAAADAAFPQILITYAARFQRVNWKYEGVAYALILKHVGVLQQTMYLVAEAMGLAGCAIGAGNADVFARAAGTAYAFCTSVGEFALGSRAPEAPPDRYAKSTSRIIWREPAPG